LVLAAVAIVLTLVILVGQMLGRPSAPDPEAAPPVTANEAPGTARNGASARPATTAAPATTAPPAAAPPSAGWLALGGARVEAAEPAGAGRRPGRFTATGAGDQGIALAGLLRCVPGRIYAASLLVRASRPGTLLEVTLLETAAGRRVAEDSIGAVLTDTGWRRVEIAHEAHRPGTALAVEVVLPRGSPRATVLVGDLVVGASRDYQVRSG
jgi:hypothetical protein